MAAPILVQESETAWNSSTSPKTTGSFSVVSGDVLVAYAVTEEADATVAITSSPSLTWTAAQTINVASNTWVAVWTATVSTTGSQTVTFTKSGVAARFFGGNCLTFDDATVGTSTKTNSTGAPSLAITTTQADSAVVAVVGDWNAIDGASRTWRTINAITPATNLAGGEATYFRDAARYVVYAAVWGNVGTAAAKTAGLSAPTGQKFSLIDLEIQGPSGTSDSSTPGVASASGSSPTARASASAGIATSMDVNQTAKTSVDTGTATGAGVTPSSTAFLSAATGVATGSSVLLNSLASEATMTGVSMTSGNPPTVRAASTQGVATTSGATPFSTSSSSTISGTALGSGAPPGSVLSTPAGIGSSNATGTSQGTAATSSSGSATSLGFSSSSSAIAPLGIAISSGVSPSVRAETVAGSAMALGNNPGMSGHTSQGSSVCAGGSLSAATATIVGVAVTIGFVPDDGSLDTTPIPGVAVGIGSSISSITSEQTTVGMSTVTGISPSISTLTSMGIAIASGLPVSSSQVIISGISVGQGADLGIAVLTTLGIATAFGFAPIEDVDVIPGVALGVGISGSSQASAIALIGIATTISFSPVIFVPDTWISLSSSSRVITPMTSSDNVQPGLGSQHHILSGLDSSYG